MAKTRRSAARPASAKAAKSASPSKKAWITEATRHARIKAFRASSSPMTFGETIVAMRRAGDRVATRRTTDPPMTVHFQRSVQRTTGS